MKKLFLLLTLGLVIFSVEIRAQKVLNQIDQEEYSQGSLQDLSWIAGYWKGTGLGGVCDEIWLPQADNSMIGIFRYFVEDKLIFSEYMHIVEEDGEISLKLKHFNRDLSPWEEKENWTIFPFIKSEGQTAYFEGLTFQRNGDEMVLYLSLTTDGKSKIEEFKYKKSEL